MTESSGRMSVADLGLMHLHPVSLEFTGPDRRLEAGFRKHYFRLSLPFFRGGWLLGIFLYAIFAGLDALAMPEVKTQLWAVRFYAVIPMMGAGLLLSFHPSFERWWQPVTCILILASGAGIAWMMVIGTPPHNYDYYAGNMLVIFFCLTMIRARFTWATPTSAAVVVMTAWAAIATSMPLVTLLRCAFFMLSAMIIGMVSCYSMEFFARQSYYLMTRLDSQQRELRKANHSLLDHIDRLKRARKEIKVLSGLIPICAHCKKIRDDRGYWNQLEEYISRHSQAEFSHALCPDCIEELYGDQDWFKASAKEPEGEKGRD